MRNNDNCYRIERVTLVEMLLTIGGILVGMLVAYELLCIAFIHITLAMLPVIDWLLSWWPI